MQIWTNYETHIFKKWEYAPSSPRESPSNPQTTFNAEKLYRRVTNRQTDVRTDSFRQHSPRYACLAQPKKTASLFVQVAYVSLLGYRLIIRA